MVIKTLASVAVISALGLLAPIQANAFGLGNIEASSALNEPFKAKIAVTAIRGDEAGNLQVRLSSDEEFERAGIERSFLLSKFKFEVVEKAGSATIFITSKDPIKEPFVDFLLTASTGNGRLIREYTVLLDPPTTIFAKPKPAQVKKPAVVKKAVQKPNTTSYQYDAPSSSSSSATSYGPTGRTDTLWDIALKTKQEKSISVHQQMIAIVKENPRAFNRQNINGLRAGYTLSIPSADMVKSLSKSQAVSAVREQNNAWKNRNAAPTTIVEQAVMPTAGTVKDVEPMVELEPATESVSETVESENNTARLKLVAPNDEALLEAGELSPMGNDDLSQLSEQLTLAQETIEGQAQENIDIKSRMDVMEEQIQTLRRLISLKDADLARLQSSLEQDKQAETDSTLEQMTEDTLALLAEQEQQLQTEQDVAGQTEGEMNEVDQYFASIGKDVIEQESISTEDDMSTDVGEVMAASVEDSALEGIDLSAIPSVDEVLAYTSNLLDMDKSEADSLLKEVKTFIAEHEMETMSGSLLLLLILWLLVRRRNRPDMTWDEAVEKLDDSDSVIAPPVYDATPESDDSDEMLVEEIEEDVVSEEFTADTQEEVLEEPEESATEKVEIIETDDDAVDMEQEISDLAFNIDSLAEEEITEEAVDISSDDNDDLMNFDPKADAETSEEAESEELSNEPLSFELGSDSDDSSTLDDESLTLDIGSDSSEESIEESDIEINIDNEETPEIDGLGEISEDEMSTATEALTEAKDLEFDLGDFDEIDEAETKLDLAAAYIDMGDPDGAKSILGEVVSEGTDEQKTRAQSMLKDLS